MDTKHFIEKVCLCLDSYSKKYTYEQLKHREIPHCHSCPNLRTKSSDSAKRLYAHLKKINESMVDKTMQIEGNDIYQFKIKGISEKQEYRCFGYFLPGGKVFHLIYLDPEHEVYKE
jgi:hypothetical protein